MDETLKLIFYLLDLGSHFHGLHLRAGGQGDEVGELVLLQQTQKQAGSRECVRAVCAE